MLIQLNVAVGHTVDILSSHFWHFLTIFSHKVVFNQPLTDKFLRKLLLLLTLFKLLLISFSIEITAGIRGMYLINQIHLAIFLSKFIFGINQYQSLLRGHF